MSSPFFSLPLELRYNIYDFLFLNTFRRFVEHGFHIRVSYKASYIWNDFFHHTHFHSYLWLATCKQIRSEALEEFYRHAICYEIFVVTPTAKFLPSPFTLHRIRKIHLRVDLAIWTREIGNGPDLRAFIAMVGGVFEKLFYDSREENDAEDAGEDSYDEDREWKWPMEIVNLRRNNVKELSLRLDPWYFPHGGLPSLDLIKEWELQLSFLEVFGTRLDKVEFETDKYWINFEREDVRTRVMLLLHLQRELERIGKGLVGGVDGQVRKGRWVARDWPGWRLEVRSSESGEEIGCIKHRGLTPFYRDSLYEKMPDGDDGMMSWFCKYSGETFSVEDVKLP